MNRLRSLLKKRRAQADPRVRRRLFSWRMFVIILLVVSVLSAGNAFALEKLLKMQVFSVVASMGVGSYWVAMAFLAALILHLYTCRRFDRPMRALSRAMRQVTEGDFSVRVKPFHSENKFDYMDIMFEDFNRMAQELGSTETMKNDFIANVSHEIRTPLTVVNRYASALASGWPWAVPVRAAVSGVWAATCRSTPRNSAKVSCVKRTTLREPSVFQKSGPGWASA